MLDVGSGDKPHWRADVLLDRYRRRRARRSTLRCVAAARVDRPLFDADAADMPFADKVFDYVICSHVLEHVERPDAVIAELARVAKAGYIEVPEAASAKIVDFPSHLWWVTLDDGVLVFTAKSLAVLRCRHRPVPHRQRDAPAVGRPPRQAPRPPCDRTALDRHDRRAASSAPRRPSSIAAAHVADAHHRGGETLAGRAADRRASPLPLRRRKHRAPIRYDDIVRARTSAPVRHASSLDRQRIYRVDA